MQTLFRWFAEFPTVVAMTDTATSTASTDGQGPYAPSAEDAEGITLRVSKAMVPNYSPLPIIPERGEGSRIHAGGREYIDLAGGIAVNSLGHGHPAVVQALTTQATKLWHMSNAFTNEPALRLAERLNELTFAERVMFSNSGAEANEAALKLARRYAYDKAVASGTPPDEVTKFEIVALEKAFHGRTLFTVTAGGTPKYKEGFGPVPSGVRHIAANDIDALANAIDHNTAAVILEPIVAEGGIITLEPAFVDRARELCNVHDALLIFDEVQTGAGRTGPLYAYMEAGLDGSEVRPDILTSAKGIGGGFPIAATLTTEEIARSFSPGTHGSTFAGNPLACAVADAVLTEITKPETSHNAATQSKALRDGLRRIAASTGLFTEIRGKGMLIGAELSPDYAGHAKAFQKLALTHGVLCLVAGPDVIRLAPALNLTATEAQLGLERLNTTAQAFTAAS